MTRLGFSLIEIIIALAISSFIGIMTFNTISFLQGSSRRYNEIIVMQSQQEILLGQFQKDISGIVVPIYGFISKKEEKPEEIEKFKKEYQALYGLRAELEGERLKSLSFVTTSALQSYGVTRPFLVRVQYLLHQDERDSRYFTLIRQESSQLGWSEFTKDVSQNKTLSHVLAFGIKTCILQCTIIKEVDGQTIVEEVSSWSFAEQVERASEAKSERVEQEILLPSLITLKGFMGDMTSGREYEYAYSASIPVAAQNIEKTAGKEETLPEAKK